MKLILKEEDPIGAIERMDGYDLLKFISSGLRLTEEVKNVLKEIKGILAWFNLLYLSVIYKPWKVYFLGLTSSLSDDDLDNLATRMQVQDKEILSMLSDRQEVRQALKELSRLKGKKNYSLYRILSPLSPEILLYSMAKTKSEKIKRSISTFFTRLKGTKIFLKGKDLIDMGYKPGLLFKEIFESILEAKLEGDISTREDEIKFINKRFGSLRDG
jgi:tRNA nucleotidyltransferase (CCA-adding enzyme)